MICFRNWPTFFLLTESVPDRGMVNFRQCDFEAAHCHWSSVSRGYGSHGDLSWKQSQTHNGNDMKPNTDLPQNPGQ